MLLVMRTLWNHVRPLILVLNRRQRLRALSCRDIIRVRMVCRLQVKVGIRVRAGRGIVIRVTVEAVHRLAQRVDILRIARVPVHCRRR